MSEVISFEENISHRVEVKMLRENEEKIMFHTLGYDYKPSWNADRDEYRNWFGIYPSDDNPDYSLIKSLIEKGYMQKDGETPWKEEIFSVTEKGKEYVVDLWEKKKKENKPSRSKRRYQAYLHWTEDIAEGTFKDFLQWLKITKKDEIRFPEDCARCREFKRKWEEKYAM